MLPPAHRDDVTPLAPEEEAAELPAGDDAASLTNANDVSTPSLRSGHNTPSGTGIGNGNGIATGFNPQPSRRKSKGPMIDEIKFIDYRYYRFMLHPDGQFRMAR